MSEPGGPITSAEVLQRATYWDPPHQPPVSGRTGTGYDQSGVWNSPEGVPYRTDCSGFVSMCLHISRHGLDSPTSADFAGSTAVPVAKASLQPGDVMSAAFGHVVLFGGWADAGQTSYNGHEFGGGNQPKHHVIPYPYFPDDGRDFKPFHYPNLIGGPITGGTTADPANPYADPTLGGGTLDDATDGPNGPLATAKALPNVAVIPNKGVSGVSAQNRLSDVVIKGISWTSKVTARVISASMSYSSQQVGELSMSIQDDTKASLMRSGIFNLGTSVDFADQHMSIRGISTPNSGGAPRCEIQCRSRAVGRLKDAQGPVTWGSVDVSKWVAARAKEVGAKAIVQNLGQTFIISRQATGDSESTWDVMQRTATKLGVWCFEYDQTIIFGKPSWLVTTVKTNQWKISWTDQDHYSANLTGMPVYTNTFDGTGLATLTFKLIGAQANQVRPGNVFTYDGPGSFVSGAWIVTAVTIPVVNGVAIAVSCQRAADPVASALTAQATT